MESSKGLHWTPYSIYSAVIYSKNKENFQKFLKDRFIKLTISLHFPPLKQGRDTHGPLNTSQNLPVYPLSQTQ